MSLCLKTQNNKEDKDLKTHQGENHMNFLTSFDLSLEKDYRQRKIHNKAVK